MVASSKQTLTSKRARRATMNHATAVLVDWESAVGTDSARRDAQHVALEDAVSTLEEAVAVARHREENTASQSTHSARRVIAVDCIVSSISVRSASRARTSRIGAPAPRSFRHHDHRLRCRPQVPSRLPAMGRLSRNH